MSTTTNANKGAEAKAKKTNKNVADPNRTVIVAAVDRSQASEAVVQTATAFAQMLIGAELHFVHVVRHPPPPIGPMVPAIGESLREGRAFVDGVAQSASTHPNPNNRIRIVGHLMAGEPYREILQLASDLEADVIVVGSNGKTALDRLIAGSVSQSVLKKAQCAVLVAQPKSYPTSDVPEIEPPCPMCVEVQRATQGDKLWCTQHAGRGIHNHAYSEGPSSFGLGSMFIRPNSSEVG